MVKVSIFKNKNGIITGFILSGHADYAEHGSDIICSAVSVLTINTINSIDRLTKDKFDLKQDEKKGLINMQIIGVPSNDTSLLLNSLALGLQAIEDEYSKKYIKINVKTKID